jgi:hypothetical protein
VQGISKHEALRHLDWAAFLDTRMEIMHLEADLAHAAPSGKLKGPAHKLATRKLAAAKKQVDAVVGDARTRAAKLEPPRNLLEFTLATFLDDEVIPRHLVDWGVLSAL